MQNFNVDFSSLYPNVMKIYLDSDIDINDFIRRRNRQKLIDERRKKLEKICIVQKEK